MPTQIPKNGFPQSTTCSLRDSRKPGIESRPFLTLGNAPWPGSTMNWALATISGHFVTYTGPVVLVAIFSKALAADLKFPEPQSIIATLIFD